MGSLTYDSKLAVSFVDRLLAHLQVFTWSMLRPGEQVYLSLVDRASPV